MNTKTAVLQKLEKSKGKPISGNAMAMKLGVSRTAVWKAVCSLRKDGHEIKGGSGRGYILSEKSDKLTAEGVRPNLKQKSDIVCFDSIDSTNKEAMRLALNEPEDTILVIANTQTSGKGRMGRTFFSPPDTGVYFSFLFRPKFDVSKSVLVTAAAATAVCRGIEKATGKVCSIKWVNDIYLGDKKICGILTEAVSGFESGAINYLIVGIGINCNTENFPEIAGNNAGNLETKISRNRLVAEIANIFLPMTENMTPGIFIEYYRSHSNVIGKKILIYPAGDLGKQDAKGTPALVKGIRDDGGLIVEYPSGQNDVLTSGEISIRTADKA